MARKQLDWDSIDERDRQITILRYYCRHLVCLAGTYQAVDQTGDPIADERGFCYSGFLIRIGNQLNIATAGHVLQRFDDKLHARKIRLQSCGLIDSLGIHATDPNPIPFDYETAPRYYVDDEAYGLDFGFIAVLPYYENLLIGNNVEPIERENWVERDNIEFDQYIMVGIPEEGIDFTKSFRPIPVIVPLSRLTEVPAGYEKPIERFVGKLSPNLPISDITGMSGGPIFGIGVAPDGKRRYWTVAVQSRWLKSKRIIFGCPFPIFMDKVERQLEQFWYESFGDFGPS